MPGRGSRLLLSPQVQQLVSDAAFSAQYVDWGAAKMPDAVTLATAVAPLSVADREVVMSSLAPELRADVETRARRRERDHGLPVATQDRTHVVREMP